MLTEFERVIRRKDMIGCVLCHDAPCTKACQRIHGDQNIDPAKRLREVWFDDEKAAAAALPSPLLCASCTAPCESECVQCGKVAIRELMLRLNETVKPGLAFETPDESELLKADLCGIPMENPFLLSSSVVASTYDMCARAFDMGWAGAAFKTICTMEIHEASPRFSALKGDNGTIIGFKNIEQLSDHSVMENMAVFRELKKNYPNKLIVASIMGQNEEEWAELPHICEDNGADAVELNFSCPNMAEGGLGSDIGQIPELVEELTAAAKSRCSVPVLAKLTPNVATMLPAAQAAKYGGADGIAAINTIKSVIDINPHTYISSPAVHGMSAVGGYSGSAVKPIALRFIDEMADDPVLEGMHLSGMGGIETWHDALEFILVGCGSLQVTTAVMQYGYRIIEDLKSGLAIYLQEKGISNVREIIGLGNEFISQTTDVLERDTILFPKFLPDRCIGCGRCLIACRDGGHQAIRFDENRRPKLDGARCVGCHLCLLVCPQNAISHSSKRITRK